MLKKVVCSFAVLGLALASAKSYNMTLSVPMSAGNTELKAGNYEVSVKGQNVVISGWKTENSIPVRVETGAKRYEATSVKYKTENGKKQIYEIQLGDSKTKLIFVEAAPLP